MPDSAKIDELMALLSDALPTLAEKVKQLPGMTMETMQRVNGWMDDQYNQVAERNGQRHWILRKLLSFMGSPVTEVSQNNGSNEL